MDGVAPPSDAQSKSSVLDNPVWNALCTTHACFAEGDDLAKQYPPEVGPFAAIRDLSSASFESLARLLGPEGVAGVFLDSPSEHASWSIIRSLRVLQMVWANSAAPANAALAEKGAIEDLGGPDVEDMLALTRLTEPGPFGTRTYELGSYLGIRQEGQLVAMAGERFRPLGYTEISAVCTHPEYQGHGYASALISALVCEIIARGEIPFLHVVEDNASAIRLYLKLGFETRRFVNIAVLKRDAARASQMRP
jgi:ribosomal protein S18 acetylase RimI-like enzyme